MLKRSSAPTWAALAMGLFVPGVPFVWVGLDYLSHPDEIVRQVNALTLAFGVIGSVGGAICASVAGALTRYK